MSGDAKAAPEVRVVPVHGANKDGKPFLGLNLQVGTGKPIIVRGDVWDALYQALPDGLPLKESIRKGILWSMTHRAARNEAGEIVIEAVKAGTSGRVVAGDAF